MSPDSVDSDATAAALKQRRGVRPFSVFLVGWAVIGALSMGAMYLAVVTLGSPKLLEGRPGGAGGSWLWSAQYTSETKFERRLDAAARPDDTSFEDLRLTLRQDLAGRYAVTQVAEELKLLEGLLHDDDGQLTREGQMAKAQIVRDLMGSIKVYFEVEEKNVDLVAVRVTHPDATLAKRIPDALVTNYINRISEQTVKRLSDSRKFLLDQVNQCKDRANDTALLKAKFEAAHADAMPENPGALNRRITAIAGEIEALRIRQEAAKLILPRLKALLDALPETRPTSEPNLVLKEVIMGANPELARLGDQLRKLKQEVESELAQKADKHPAIVTLRQRISQVEKRIAETPVEVVVRRVYVPGDRTDSRGILLVKTVEAQAELETVAREIERLQKRREPLLALMTNFAKISQDYRLLVEKLSKERLELDTWEKRYTAVQMDLAAEVAKRRIRYRAVQAAEEQSDPDTLPPAAIMAVVAAVTGAIGGSILAMLARLLNRRSARRALA